MAIWIQSLSWTLIYSLGQGCIVYASLWLVLKLLPSTSASVKYHLSLSAITILFAWFVTTWLQQYHSFTLAYGPSLIPQANNTVVIQQSLWEIVRINNHPTLLSFVKVISPWLTAFYLIGLMLMLVRLSAGMLQLFSLRRNGISQPDNMLDEMVSSLKNKLHFEGHAQLLVSAKAQVPMVIGFFKPIILMPVAAIAQLSTQQLETILLHELAHIKRYDYLVNILQTVVETILFFNPFVWLISAIIRREREHCCDDLVLDHTCEPLFYATALEALATHPNAVSVFTVAASGTPNHLFNRIKRIVEMKKNPFSYSKMVAAIFIIAGITCSIAWLTPSFVKSEKDKPGKTTAPSATPQVDKEVLQTNQSEENQLVMQLLGDGLINQVKGFVVEKQQNKLYIDGQLQTDEIANKYLRTITKEMLKVQVYPFIERLNMHPDASFIQLLLPVSLSSPCVDNGPKKPGC